MLTKLVCLGVIALGATAQEIPGGIKYDLTDLTYSRVGWLARVQGVVQLQLLPTEAGQEVKFVSGPAMLVREARENLAKWRTNQPVTVNYIFRLTEPEMVKVRVPKGDAFDRFWLRMFRLATFTEESRCQQTSSSLLPHVSEPRAVKTSPLIIEVEVAVQYNCLVMQTALVASR